MTSTPSKPKRGFTLIELLVVLSIIAMLIAFLYPTRRGGREAARRSQCKNNLKQIGLALYNYAERYGAFPPAYTVDAEGHRLHSWRTLILPFMDEEAIYKRIDLTKPWNDPANADAFNDHIPAFVCPSPDCPPNHTKYLALVGENAAFHPREERSVRSFADGASETLLVIEVPHNQTVHWMSPEDADEELLLSFSPDTPLPHQNGFHGLFADGSVRHFPADTPESIRRALHSIAGDDKIEPGSY